MVVHHSKAKQLLTVLLAATLFIATSTQPVSLSNCQETCGSVTIPFPFGTTKGCSLDSTFLISCNQTSSNPSPFLLQTNITILNISLNGELRVEWPVASDCYAERNKRLNQTFQELNLTTPFHISSSRNKLTAVSCDTLGILGGFDSEGRNYTAACLALCNGLDDVANGSCSGAGCCETSIPRGFSSVTYVSQTVFNHTGVVDFNPCGYAFLVEDGGYHFSSTDLIKLEKMEYPVVLAWAVGNQTCLEAKKEVSNSSYACKAENSECYDSPEGPGYFCNCSYGFRGNPYLIHGCLGNKYF